MHRPGLALMGLRFSGVLLLEAALLMMWFGPSGPYEANPPGFGNAVVGLELAASPDEVLAILGPVGSVPGSNIRGLFYQATMIDFLFLACYSAFNLFLALYLYYRGSISAELVFGMAFFSILMALADAQENLAIIRLLDSQTAESLWSILPSLRNWTIVKWVSLGVASAIAASGLWKQAETIHATLFGLAAALGILGTLHRPAFEWQSLFLGLAWIGVWYKSFPLPGGWAKDEDRKRQAKTESSDVES